MSVTDDEYPTRRHLTATEPPPDYDDPSETLTHAQPNDDLAERYVIGAAMADPTQLDTCARLLTASDFYRPAHETIWRAILDLRATGQPTQAAAVAAHLTDAGTITKVGGAPHLFDCYQAASVPATAAYYADRVDQLARRRKAITELQRGLQRLRAPGADTDVDEALTSAHTALSEAALNLANPDLANTWAPVDLAAVLAGEHLDPPPTMLHRTDGIPLLYDGAVHTVSGESESGKTWLTLIAALQLFGDGHDVAFVDFEDRADRVVGRLLALGATIDQVRDHFRYIRPDRPLDTDGRAGLLQAIDGTRLTILDGVTEAMTMHGYDLQSNADAATFYGLLPRWIADRGPAVVMIDHVVKDKDKQDRHALGAQHKLAGIDGAAYMVKTIQPFARSHRGIARINVSKDRPGHVREHAHGSLIAEFTLDATAGDHLLIAHLMPPGEVTGRNGETWEPTHLMEKISRIVQLTPGLPKTTITDLCNGKTTAKRTALELLVTRGYIGTKTGPKNAIQHFHIKPYYDTSDPDETDETDTS